MKLNAAVRLRANEGDVIAPAESYQPDNKNELKTQQQDHKQEIQNPSTDSGGEGEHNNQYTASEADSSDHLMDATEIHDMRASSTHTDGEPTLDASEVQYAIKAHRRLLADRLNTESDPLTMCEENASSTVDGIVPNSEEGFPQSRGEGEGYLNVGETLADADPKLFNIANQPLG